MLQENIVTKEEFAKAVDELLKTVKLYAEKKNSELKKEADEYLADFEDKTSKILGKIKKAADDQTNSFEGGIVKRLNKAIKEQEDGMNYLRDKVRGLKDGQDADEENIINEVIRRLSENEPEDKEETPEEIRNKLELLQGEERLDKSAINGLVEELEQIRQIKSSRGGGVSAIGVAQAFKFIAHTEAPSGDIDGVNTTYTVKNAIFWVAGFTLNGEQIAELPNFTYSGKTITFGSAIPAAYSGKDFEIKYIGV